MGPWTSLSETAYTSLLTYIYSGKSLYILNEQHHSNLTIIELFCYEILNFRNFANFLPSLT